MAIQEFLSNKSFLALIIGTKEFAVSLVGSGVFGQVVVVLGRKFTIVALIRIKVLMD